MNQVVLNDHDEVCHIHFSISLLELILQYGNCEWIEIEGQIIQQHFVYLRLKQAKMGSLGHSEAIFGLKIYHFGGLRYRWILGCK
jgi:hypothetical protein